MQQVNIYIDQQFNGNFKSGDGRFSVVLEVQTEKGPVTRVHYKGYTGTSKNRLAILACTTALEYMKRPCKVTIHIDSPYVTVSADKLEEWQEQGIEKHKNYDLWKKYIDLARIHMVNFVQAKENQYSPAMRVQMNVAEFITLEDYRPENEME